MGQHLELAKQFVAEQHQQQQNLLGALLVGSTARSEETAFSDIDLRLIVQPATDDALDRNGIDTWRDGIYIDALPVTWDDYTDLERILTHPIRANDMNSGLLLHDPTGLLAQRQREAQSLFMAAPYIARRVQSLTGRVTPRLTNMQQAIAVNDQLHLCAYTGRLVFELALIPLIQQGIAPSSTRHLRQLGQIAPLLYDQLCAVEGSAQMASAAVRHCHQIFAQLSYACDTTRWGHMPDYVVKKMAWMIDNGYEREALHAMWINGGFRVNDCLQSENPATIAAAQQLTQAWLTAVEWNDQATFETKQQQLTQIWVEMQAALTPLLSTG